MNKLKDILKRILNFIGKVIKFIFRMAVNNIIALFFFIGKFFVLFLIYLIATGNMFYTVFFAKVIDKYIGYPFITFLVESIEYMQKINIKDIINLPFEILFNFIMIYLKDIILFIYSFLVIFPGDFFFLVYVFYNFFSLLFYLYEKIK